MNIQELPKHQQSAAEFVIEKYGVTENQKQAYFNWLKNHPNAYKMPFSKHESSLSVFQFTYETPTEHVTVIFKP